MGITSEQVVDYLIDRVEAKRNEIEAAVKQGNMRLVAEQWGKDLLKEELNTLYRQVLDRLEERT